MKGATKSPSAEAALREHLVALLRGGHAHLTFDQAVRGFPLDRIGVRPPGLPHSAWELLEHIRLAQEDILRFSQSAEYVSPPFPDGYWPASPAPQRDSQWTASVRRYRKDLAAFEALIVDPASNLRRKFLWGTGQTLLREAFTIADHTSYHLGQLALVRKLVER
jgi:hypothetical protein